MRVVGLPRSFYRIARPRPSAEGLRVVELSSRAQERLRPKLNDCVERAQRTHQEEFYEVEDFPLDMAGLNRALLAWEHTYNHLRPHQALDGRTPA